MALFNYECDEVKRKIDEVSPNYPQLTTFEKEWLFFHKYHYIPGVPVELECETVSINPYGHVSNAIPFQYKRAILKGQTKIMDELGNECESTNSPGVTMGGYINPNNGEIVSSEVSFYTAFLKCPTVSFVIKGDNKYKRISFYDKNKTFLEGINNMDTTNTPITISYSSIPSTAVYMIISASTSTSETYTPNTILLIEDTKGKNLYTTHFESVQMPVLKTTGKNLFDGEMELGTITTKGVPDDSDNCLRSVNFIKINPSTLYTITNDLGYTIAIYEYDSDFNFIKNTTYNNKAYTTSENTAYIKIKTSASKVETDLSVKLQIEEGDVGTSYEPYKSNSLTVNEDVELRGIGEVKDELNLLTGEMTQRIRKFVFDGSEPGWHNPIVITNNGYAQSYFVPSDRKSHSAILTNFLPIVNKEQWNSPTQIGIYNGDGGTIGLIIKADELPTQDFSGFKKWLSQNPITVYYQLATESVKTVALTPLNKPYEGTNHYELTSNIPCEAILEVPVVSTGKQTLEEINN